MPPNLHICKLDRAQQNKAYSGWKQAIKDWLYADGDANPVVLKDWKHSWHSKENRERFGVLYLERKLVYQEYEKYVLSFLFNDC